MEEQNNSDSAHYAEPKIDMPCLDNRPLASRAVLLPNNICNWYTS